MCFSIEKQIWVPWQFGKSCLRSVQLDALENGWSKSSDFFRISSGPGDLRSGMGLPSADHLVHVPRDFKNSRVKPMGKMKKCVPRQIARKRSKRPPIFFHADQLPFGALPMGMSQSGRKSPEPRATCRWKWPCTPEIGTFGHFGAPMMHSMAWVTKQWVSSGRQLFWPDFWPI